MFCKVSSWNVLHWVRLSKNYLNLSASFAFLQREASDIVNSGLDIQWFFDIRLTRAPIFPYLLTLLNNAMNDFSPERGPLSDWWGRCCPLPRAPPAFAFQLTAWKKDSPSCQIIKLTWQHHPGWLLHRPGSCWTSLGFPGFSQLSLRLQQVVIQPVIFYNCIFNFSLTGLNRSTHGIIQSLIITPL